MKSLHSCLRARANRTAFGFALGIALATAASLPSHAQSLSRQISQDSFTNPSSQHMTEVEPSAATNGPVIVAAFQVGRISGGGGADIGFATSLNGGISWTNGYLPGLTQNGPGGGPNSAASDASVAYNAKFGKWIICTLPIGNFDTVAVSRSTNGLTWDNPIYVVRNTDVDKNWIACDNNPSSPFYGNCYVEFDNTDDGDLLFMSTSTDGGVTWGTPQTTQGTDFGIGGNPVVQPNGTVIVPFADFVGGMSAFQSTNGGQSWTRAVSISTADQHGIGGGLRQSGLPSAAIDGAGNVYVVWEDCRFESGCTANDMVLSQSSDGTHWSAVSRIPLDPVGSGVDHFIPGLGVDSRTSGSTAHLGLTYYYYPVANCNSNTCRLIAGFSLSQDGGQTWTAGRQLTPTMQISWLPNTFSGRMVADYVATVFPAGGRAFPIYALATQPTGSTFHEAIYTTSFGFSQDEMTEPLMSSANDKPIPGIKGDRPPKTREYRDNLSPREQQVPPQK
jgi:hypothetical protein